ncbi:MAG TPA: R3H domain-containing nucleic acid-binding protein [Terriglobia bacterium]|nr:R3H domain-containing nucleic acid-binding protein [Terriglobia bacterium]
MAPETTPAAEPSPALERYRAPIQSLVRDIIHHGGFRLDFKIRPGEPAGDFEAPEWVVDFSGADAGLLLEAHAELLNAIEYVVLRAARVEESLFPKIAFDCEHCRRLRIEELRLMAQVAADRVRDLGVPFPLGPMNARERRVVHLALHGRPEVRTESEGQGPERRVVIHPASTPARR